jgi:hypothetical protein
MGNSHLCDSVCSVATKYRGLISTAFSTFTVMLLPAGFISTSIPSIPPRTQSVPRSPRRLDRPTYGDPIDFRGLRHEPVNEDGVVFLFGMVARELGYLVEAVQAGFPDCEAKLQIAPSKWQRVRRVADMLPRLTPHGRARWGAAAG